MKTVVSLVSVMFCLGVSACGAIDDSTPGLKAEGGVCVETVPPLDNTAQLQPDAAAPGGGS